MNLLHVCRVSEGTLHISLHHTHSSALLPLKWRSSLLLSPCTAVPHCAAHLRPTCPRRSSSPPPCLKIKLEAIYGSQRAGKALTNWIFFDRIKRRKKTSISSKVRETGAFDQFHPAAHRWYKYSKCSVGLSPYLHHRSVLSSKTHSEAPNVVM